MNGELEREGRLVRPSNPAKGHRLATILSVIASIVVLGVVVFVLAVRQGFKGLARTDCGESLRQIGLRCREYAASHDGRFPSTWVELKFVGEDANWAQLLRCPSTGHGVGDWAQVDLWADYRLIPGRTTNDPPGTILAVEPLANHGSTGANVLFVDGCNQWWPAWRILGREKAPR
jgi:prepilin-type processing-associated H-X9-DG protein